MESEIDEMVQEYLKYRDFKQTLHTFQEEAGLNLSSDHRIKESVKAEKVQEFLNALNNGSRNDFFVLWNALPEHDDDASIKIEFLLNVYFAILPIHDFVNCQKESMKTSMNYFKQFLDTKGSALCKNDAFLCFYALPYIPEESLKKHPSFHQIFTMEWVQDLQMRMTGYLENILNLESLVKFPRLIHLYQVCFYF